ncbi:hypothetical protein WR25_12139 [Diploscapter pachys]|uniref:Uncharacterized protein n=1 Tax=Diploscapter pachys TaxID=2018661 RepID=A0A2A2K3V7_9BILA|nr:hypothetical protein WR25_12139 [Diploscapter pachys]
MPNETLYKAVEAAFLTSDPNGGLTNIQKGSWPDYPGGSKWSDTDKENFHEYWLKRLLEAVKEGEFTEVPPTKMLGRR